MFTIQNEEFIVTVLYTLAKEYDSLLRSSRRDLKSHPDSGIATRWRVMQGRPRAFALQKASGALEQLYARTRLDAQSTSFGSELMINANDIFLDCIENVAAAIASGYSEDSIQYDIVSHMMYNNSFDSEELEPKRRRMVEHVFLMTAFHNCALPFEPSNEQRDGASDLGRKWQSLSATLRQRTFKICMILAHEVWNPSLLWQRPPYRSIIRMEFHIPKEDIAQMENTLMKRIFRETVVNVFNNPKYVAPIRAPSISSASETTASTDYIDSSSDIDADNVKSDDEEIRMKIRDWQQGVSMALRR